MNEPQGERRGELLSWLLLETGPTRFENELAMTTAATREVWANGDELDFLASWWRRAKGEAMTEPPAPEPTTEIAVRDMTRMDELARLGSWLALAESDSETEKAKGAAAALRLYYAQELGLTPLAANELSIIRGRLVVGAKLVRAFAERQGYVVQRVELTDDRCTARLVERATGEVLGETTFTMADARTAGLIKDRSAWKTHPRRMLWARASKLVVDDYAPSVSLGMLEDSEAEEIGGPPAPVPPEPEPTASPVVTDSEIAEGLDEAEEAEFWPADSEGDEAAA